METTAPKKRRSKPRKRRRIAASMIRPRAVSGASRASRFRQSASRRFVPPAAAMAVLRRARETAVAAAQAAADAAALIERSRAQRQDFFDEQRGIPGPETSDKIAYTRSRRRRRRRLATTAQTTANGREGATMRPDAPRGRTYRRRNAAYWGRRRERRKLRQAQERTAASIYDPYDEVIKVENLSPAKGRSKPRRSKRIAAAMVKSYVVAETGTKQATRLRRPPSTRFASSADGVEALRGTRETAAVAAQVTMNTAALVEQRQDYDDGHYGIAGCANSGKIVLSRTQKRRRQRLAAAAKSAHFPTGKASRRRTTVYGTRRRVRHRLRRTPEQAASVDCNFDDGNPQPDFYPFEPEPYSNIPGAYPVTTGYEGYDCSTRFDGGIHSPYGPALVNPVVYVPVPSNLCYSCLCYGDYLARARAWFQARNEQLSVGFHFPFEPPYHMVSVPRTANWGAPFQWNPRQVGNRHVSSFER